MIGDYIQKDGKTIQLKTEEDTKGPYSIFDVVIPIIGSETELNYDYPMDKIYCDLLKEENVSVDTFKNHNKRYYKKFCVVWRSKENARNAKER